MTTLSFMGDLRGAGVGLAGGGGKLGGFMGKKVGELMGMVPQAGKKWKCCFRDFGLAGAGKNWLSPRVFAFRPSVVLPPGRKVLEGPRLSTQTDSDG